MTETLAQATAMREAFDKIEEAYEFMLAYAAQGRKREVEEGAGSSQIRQYLSRFQSALDQFNDAIGDGFGAPEGAAYTDQLRRDIAVAKAIIALLLSRPSISSDMIDNTNGLIAMRMLLTDIFFVDQVLLPDR